MAAVYIEECHLYGAFSIGGEHCRPTCVFQHEVRAAALIMKLKARDISGWMPLSAYIYRSSHMYGRSPVFCQPAYAKLIMLIELDHGVIWKIGLFIIANLGGHFTDFAFGIFRTTRNYNGQFIRKGISVRVYR